MKTALAASALAALFLVPARTVSQNPPASVPAPAAQRGAARVTLLSSGDSGPALFPVHKGMLVPDDNVDGGLKAVNLSMPPVTGVPFGSVVVIFVNIDENGDVTSKKVLLDAGGMGAQVKKAARSWKFSPPTAKGVPIKTAIAVKVSFPGPSPAPNPLVTPKVTVNQSGDCAPIPFPVQKGMTLPDFYLDGCPLKPLNLSMAPVSGAVPNSFVLIRIEIDETGSVTSGRVMQDNSGFGPQVMTAARSWKFSPPTAKGKPVKTATMVKVTF